MPERQKRRTSLRKKSRTPYYVAALIAVVAVAGIGWYAYTALNKCSTPNVQAVINTTQGSMNVTLFSCSAPKTVANFVSLARSGFYNDLVWHRIAKGFVIQTGDPTSRNGGGTPANWGSTGSNQTVPLEIDPKLQNNLGYLAMARTSDPNSGSSQFFINLANNTSLNEQYTVFGAVTSGSSVAVAIGNLPVNLQCSPSTNYSECQPTNPSQAMILSVTIISGG
jgi:cyclophilin family peptidyl-prolyl cis-trans isomerase